jgi:hypothetical protein
VLERAHRTGRHLAKEVLEFFTDTTGDSHA